MVSWGDRVEEGLANVKKTDIFFILPYSLIGLTAGPRVSHEKVET